MALLTFTLTEEGVAALREALSCLNKFNDEVSLEARREKLVFTTINSSKSAYACFTFPAEKFCSRYNFVGNAQNRDKFYCNLYNKALQAIFRSRSVDAGQPREKETAIEKCEVAIEDEAGKASRFIVKIICRNGLTTKYRLPFEVSVPVHAKFNKSEATNQWAIQSRTLRQLMDHFGPGTEYLDIHADDEYTVNFTCFTEKIKQGEELLKKPLHTSIAVDREEFKDFEVSEDKLHIIVSVKDFRAIAQHAASMGSEIQALYSFPSSPLRLSYGNDYVKCEFLLMTVGERGAPGQKTKKTRAGIKPTHVPALEASSGGAASKAPTHSHQSGPASGTVAETIPSLRPSRVERAPQQQQPRQQPPPPTAPPALEEDESLFVAQDNDEQWDPVNLNEDEDEDDDARLEWNASGQPNPSTRNLASFMASRNVINNADNGRSSSHPPASHIEPTQRLSDVRKFGLFGD